MNRYQEELRVWKEKYVALSLHNWTDYQVLEEAVRSQRFKHVEFININQVCFCNHNTDEEIAFHNNGIPPEDFNAYLNYTRNLE